MMMDIDKSGDIDKNEALKFLKGFSLGHGLKSLLRNPE